jgi:hypothetical protein
MHSVPSKVWIASMSTRCRGIGSGMRRVSHAVYRVGIVPIGETFPKVGKVGSAIRDTNDSYGLGTPWRVNSEPNNPRSGEEFT